MTWSQVKANAIREAALAVVADATAHPLDREAAQRTLARQYDYRRLTLAELNLMEQLERRLLGERTEPVARDSVAAADVAPRARCTRCDGFSDTDLAELREVLAEPANQVAEQVEQE